MFSLTIVFGPGPMVWTLMYKTREAAESARSFLRDNGDHIGMIDDFGQECEIKTSNIQGWMLEDLDQSKLAHIERALHQARTKIKADELADSDPAIRQGRLRQQGGLGMIQPMPGGLVGANGRFPS